MSLGSQLRAAGALVAINGIIPVRRTPLFLVNALGAPFSFLFIIYVVSQGRFVGFGVAGGLVLTTFSIGTSLQADMTHFRVDLKLQDMLVASPVRAWSYVLGMALSELAFAVPGIATFVVVGFVTEGPGDPLALPIIVATLLLVWSLGSSLGFFLATYLRDVRETFAVSPLISLVLSVLPPVYYPFTSLPEAYRWLGYLAPTADASHLIQGALGIISPLAPLDWARSFGILLAFTLALMALATFKAQWREA